MVFHTLAFPSSRRLRLLRDCPQERARPIPIRLGEPFKNLTLVKRVAGVNMSRLGSRRLLYLKCRRMISLMNERANHCENPSTMELFNFHGGRETDLG